jgi:nitrogenase molybdenum-cofactor synthesis protein NifE
MGEDALMIEDGNPRALINIVREHGVDILIAGGRNMYTALKARIAFLDINQEREFGYAGYTGVLELAKQLCLTIENPVWEAVRRPAPWARGERTAHGSSFGKLVALAKVGITTKDAPYIDAGADASATMAPLTVEAANA